MIRNAGAVAPAARHVSARPRFPFIFIALTAALICSVLLAVAWGSVRVPVNETVRVIGHHLAPGYVAPASDPLYDQIVWQFRLPRALLGVVVGAGLAIVGAVLQATIRNPLADPYVLGISSGASMGAVALVILGPAIVSSNLLSLAAFAGALLATALVYLVARSDGRVTPLRMVLAGVALAYLFQAVYSYLLLIGDPRAAQRVMFWLLGSLGSADWSDLGIPAVVVVAGSVFLLTQARSLNALVAGEEIATSVGVNVHRFRLAMLIVTSLLVGVMVAVTGAIAFVGLIIPHAVRIAIGSDHRRLLPAAALCGAIFLVLVDIAARTIVEPIELPLTIVTAAIGVPVFVLLLRRKGNMREGAS